MFTFVSFSIGDGLYRNKLLIFMSTHDTLIPVLRASHLPTSDVTVKHGLDLIHRKPIYL